MPRLEDGQLIIPQSKFKKRRAWILPEEITPAINASPAPETDNLASQKSLIVTRLEHDCNMSITRLEHDYNKTVTRVEQKIPRSKAVKPEANIRLEHDYNKSVTRLEHDYNLSITTTDPNHLIGFVVQQKIFLDNFEFSNPWYLVVSLSDVQRKVFWHIALECIKRGVPRTGPIEIKGFFEGLEISIPVVRTTLNRLVEKDIIQREPGKLGKNGFAIIALPKMIFDVAAALLNDFNNQTKKR
jgi:hypothetical protein